MRSPDISIVREYLNAPTNAASPSVSEELYSAPEFVPASVKSLSPTPRCLITLSPEPVVIVLLPLR